MLRDTHDMSPIAPPTPDPLEIPDLVVILSRGHLKAYEPDPSQSSGLRLFDEMEFLSPHDWQRPDDGETERNVVMVSAAPLEESVSTDGEAEAGALRRMAVAVGRMLHLRQPATWWYAAPGDIHELVLNALEETYRQSITRQVRSDLTDVPSRKLRKHFENLTLSTSVSQPD